MGWGNPLAQIGDDLVPLAIMVDLQSVFAATGKPFSELKHLGTVYHNLAISRPPCTIFLHLENLEIFSGRLGAGSQTSCGRSLSTNYIGECYPATAQSQISSYRSML